MSNKEFHKPFIKSLVVIASFTILLMIIAPLFINSLTSSIYKTGTFTTINSQKSLESNK